MKKLVLAVWVLGMVIPVMAQDQQSFLGPKEVKPIAPTVKEKIENVVKKFKVDEFDDAYNSYVELLAVKGKISPNKHKQALLEMARAYMELSVWFRLEHGYSYFTGSWQVDTTRVEIFPFLEQQKKIFSSVEQKEYAAFLQRVQEDIKDYVSIHTPPAQGGRRTMHPAAR